MGFESFAHNCSESLPGLDNKVRAVCFIVKNGSESGSWVAIHPTSGPHPGPNCKGALTQSNKEIDNRYLTSMDEIPQLTLLRNQRIVQWFHSKKLVKNGKYTF